MNNAATANRMIIKKPSAFDVVLVIGRQHIAANVREFEEHRIRQDVTNNALWPEARCAFDRR